MDILSYEELIVAERMACERLESYGKTVALAQYNHMVKLGWVKLDPDQSLPDTPECGFTAYPVDQVRNKCVTAQNDMLKAGWRKVKEAQDER